MSSSPRGSPPGYLATTDWLHEIAEVWAAYADPYDGVTRHVLFAGALDAGITPVSNGRLRMLLVVRKLRTQFPMLFRLFPRRAREVIERRIEPARVREQPAGATGAIFGHSRERVRVILDKDGLGREAAGGAPARFGRRPNLRPSSNSARSSTSSCS